MELCNNNAAEDEGVPWRCDPIKKKTGKNLNRAICAFSSDRFVEMEAENKIFDGPFQTLSETPHQ